MAANSIDDLIKDILVNPDVPANMSKDQVVSLQKKVDLYGVVVPAERAWINFSITNWREQYLRKITTTALIGYLFRVQSEYTKSELDEVKMPEDLYKALGVDSSKLSKEEAKRADTEFATQIRAQLGVFLKRMFEYDPDRHVRVHYKDNVDDPERAGKFAEMKTAMKTGVEKKSSLDELLVKLKDKLAAEDYAALEAAVDEVGERNAMLFTKSRDLVRVNTEVSRAVTSYEQHNPKSNAEFLSAVDKSLSALPGDIAKEIQSVISEYVKAANEFDVNELRVELAKANAAFTEIADTVYPTVVNRIAGAYTWLPPSDVFHHFERYFQNHYELFRDAVRILYSEKPDVEFAVQFYDTSFPDEVSAKKARDRIQDRVVANVVNVSNEGWFMLGPFKKNQERLEFYNKNTEIIKRMLEQQEADQKIGSELMQKRVKRSKQKNIVEAGPDDPGLKKYQEALSVVESLGAKKGMTDEEKRKFAEALTTKEMAEVPQGAIQVDMQVPVLNEEGETVGLERKKFYTEAEAPAFMEDHEKERRAFTNALSMGATPEQAQAAAQRVIDERTDAKTLQSRDGKKITVRELRDNIQ